MERLLAQLPEQIREKNKAVFTWWESKVVNQDIPWREGHDLDLLWWIAESLNEIKQCKLKEHYIEYESDGQISKVMLWSGSGICNTSSIHMQLHVHRILYLDSQMAMLQGTTVPALQALISH